MTKKEEQRKIKQLKKKLWKELSIYVRQRAKGICFTCGIKKHWKEMQAGHCMPKPTCNDLLNFHPINIQCQCYRCNINLGGNGAVFAQKIIDKYGYSTFLKLLADNEYKINHGIKDLEYLLNQYQELNKRGAYDY